MRKKYTILFALLLISILPSYVNAALVITTNSSFTTQHNTILNIPVNVTNTGNNVTSINMTITNLTSQSQILPIDVNPDKKSIVAGGNESYIINYPISQYTYAGTYPVKLNVSANENGTLVSVSKTFNVVVQQSAALETDKSGIGMTLAPGSSFVDSFVLINNGNVDLTNINIVQQTDLKDSQGDTAVLRITSSRNLALLRPGESAVIYINTTASQDLNAGTYSTILRINSVQGATKDFAFNLYISRAFCIYGNKGSFFEVSISEPETSDDFYPGDDVQVKVKVRNTDDDDQDIVISADLFDETDNSFLDIGEEVDESLDSNSYDYFYLTLTVPTDVEESHSYRLYVKAYEDGNEEEQCYEKYQNFEVKRLTHELIIEKAEYGEFTCGIENSMKITISNTGKKDEDVLLKVYNKEFSISSEKEISVDNTEKTKTEMLINIPYSVTSGNHTLTVEASYYKSGGEYKNSIKKDFSVLFKDLCSKPTSDAVLSYEVLDKAYAGEKFKTKINIYNTGDVATAYTIVASNYDSWAKLVSVEPAVLTLEPKQTSSVYITLTPLDSASIGTNIFKVKAIYLGKTTEKEVLVELNKKTSLPSSYEKISKKLSDLSGFDIITVNIVLIIAIILVIVWILRIRRRY